MPPYRVVCYSRDCDADAFYKIAAVWSDGLTSELKTYSLCCAKCLGEAFADAKRRLASCRLALGESLGQPQIFEFVRGAVDRTLKRREDLEVL
jgi:hypothetical protein